MGNSCWQGYAVTNIRRVNPAPQELTSYMGQALKFHGAGSPTHGAL